MIESLFNYNLFVSFVSFFFLHKYIWIIIQVSSGTLETHAFKKKRNRSAVTAKFLNYESSIWNMKSVIKDTLYLTFTLKRFGSEKAGQFISETLEPSSAARFQIKRVQI